MAEAHPALPTSDPTAMQRRRASPPILASGTAAARPPRGCWMVLDVAGAGVAWLPPAAGGAAASSRPSCSSWAAAAVGWAPSRTDCSTQSHTVGRLCQLQRGRGCGPSQAVCAGICPAPLLHRRRRACGCCCHQPSLAVGWHVLPAARGGGQCLRSPGCSAPPSPHRARLATCSSPACRSWTAASRSRCTDFRLSASCASSWRTRWQSCASYTSC